MKFVKDKKTGLKIRFGFEFPLDVEDRDWAGTGKFGTWLVPDYICGISIKKSACVHDDCYEHGLTEEDKRQADEAFRYNLDKQIANCDLSLRTSASATAWAYYVVVDLFGDNAFWNGKTKPKSWFNKLCFWK